MTWAMVAVLGGMVGLPLSVVVLYVRAIREDQKQQRVDHASLERRVGYIERDFTTKEEWLREAALNRQKLDEVTRLLIALQARGETETGLAVQFGRLADTLAKAVAA